MLAPADASSEVKGSMALVLKLVLWLLVLVSRADKIELCQNWNTLGSGFLYPKIALAYHLWREAN